jgi:hypothetical protein
MRIASLATQQSIQTVLNDQALCLLNIVWCKVMVSALRESWAAPLSEAATDFCHRPSQVSAETTRLHHSVPSLQAKDPTTEFFHKIDDSASTVTVELMRAAPINRQISL